MNDLTFEVMQKIEILSLDELEKVNTWIEYCIEKRKNSENSASNVLSD